MKILEPDAVTEQTPMPTGDSASPAQATLRDLSAAAMAGDHDAFTQLHRRVGGGLRRLLLKRSGGREDLVDDLCQKTWTSIWNALQQGKYDPERAAITTFVYAVGNNAWLTHLRTFARDRGFVNGAPAMLGESHIDGDRARTVESPDDARIQAETIECVRACLRESGPAGLTEQERSIVRAIAGGETDRGLARRLGLSSSTVNIRKHAGYTKIREYLQSRGLAADDFVEPESPVPVPVPIPTLPPSPRQSGGGGAGRETALAADHAGRLP